MKQQLNSLITKLAIVGSIASAITLMQLSFTPSFVFAATPPPAASSGGFTGATDCNFLPAQLCPKDGDINAVIGGVANWMVGLIGAVIVIMIVVSGVQMASAADSPDRLKAAKTRLTNAIVSLILLLTMRAILALLGIAV